MPPAQQWCVPGPSTSQGPCGRLILRDLETITCMARVALAAPFLRRFFNQFLDLSGKPFFSATRRIKPPTWPQNRAQEASQEASDPSSDAISRNLEKLHPSHAKTSFLRFHRCMLATISGEKSINFRCYLNIWFPKRFGSAFLQFWWPQVVFSGSSWGAKSGQRTGIFDVFGPLRPRCGSKRVQERSRGVREASGIDFSSDFQLFQCVFWCDSLIWLIGLIALIHWLIWLIGLVDWSDW